MNPTLWQARKSAVRALPFQADVINDTASDISIVLQLSKRVNVKQAHDGVHVTHVGENPQPEDDARPVQLYVKGGLVSE